MPLRIGPVTYLVEFVDDPRLDGMSADGVHDPRDAVIRIAAHLPREMTAVVLWHEILHGIEVDRGITLTEREVEAISRGIVAVMMDNPDWISRLVPKSSQDVRWP